MKKISQKDAIKEIDILIPYYLKKRFGIDKLKPISDDELDRMEAEENKQNKSKK